MPKFNFNNKSKKFQSHGVNDKNKFRYVIPVVNFMNVGLFYYIWKLEPQIDCTRWKLRIW